MASELHGGKKQTCRAQAALKTLLPRDSLNGFLLGISQIQSYAILTVVNFKEESFGKKKILLLALLPFVFLSSSLAHGNSLYIWMTLIVSLSATILTSKIGLKNFVTYSALACIVSSIAIAISRYFYNNNIFYSTRSRDWEHLINTNHFGIYEYLPTRFYYYLPPWKAGPYAEINFALLVGILASVTYLYLAYKGHTSAIKPHRPSITNKVTLLITFFATMPISTFAFYMAPPISDALIRYFPGDPNGFYRIGWGAILWVTLPVLLHSCLRIAKYNHRKVYFFAYS